MLFATEDRATNRSFPATRQDLNRARRINGLALLMQWAQEAFAPGARRYLRRQPRPRILARVFTCSGSVDTARIHRSFS
jgi:hypothetical protein